MIKSKVLLGYWSMIMVALLFSLGGLLIKVIPWHPLAINGIRSILAVVVLGLARKDFKIKFKRLTLVSAVALATTNVLFVMANKLTLAANAIVLQYTSPIYILILGMIIYNHRPSKSKWLVVIMALSGMVLFFFDQLSGGMLLGNILALLSGVTYAMVFFFSGHESVDPQESIMLAGWISFALGIPFYFVQIDPGTIGWVSLLALGIFQQGFAYLCFSYGIKRISSINANLICLSEILLSTLLVWLVLNERPGPYALVGGSVIISAILLNILVDYLRKKKSDQLTGQIIA